MNQGKNLASKKDIQKLDEKFNSNFSDLNQILDNVLERGSPTDQMVQNQNLNNNLLNENLDPNEQNRETQQIQQADKNAQIEENEQQPKIRITKRRRRKSTTPMLHNTVEQVERDISYMNKYTTEEILRTLEQTTEGQMYIIDSIRKSHKPIKRSRNQVDNSEISPEKYMKEDPIDQIIVGYPPLKEEEKQEGMVTIYQQVSEVYEDSTRYEGEKFLGKRHGKGTYYYQEGYKYEGEWEEDQMSGFGILWINDDIKWYEGEWSDNAFHGRGILYNLTPEELQQDGFYGENFSNIGNGWLRYEGQFYKGTKHGFGCLMLTNGDKFVGHFNADNVEGRGSYTKPDQYVIAGIWENNNVSKTF